MPKINTIWKFTFTIFLYKWGPSAASLSGFDKDKVKENEIDIDKVKEDEG